jgi:hypothetical protein
MKRERDGSDKKARAKASAGPKPKRESAAAFLAREKYEASKLRAAAWVILQRKQMQPSLKPVEPMKPEQVVSTGNRLRLIAVDL